MHRIKAASEKSEVIFGRVAYGHFRSVEGKGVFISLATHKCTTAAFRFVFPEDNDYDAHVDAWNTLFSMKRLPLITSMSLLLRVFLLI